MLESLLNKVLKETPTQMFCCEYCKVSKNNYFEEHLRTAASVLCLTNIWQNATYRHFILHTTQSKSQNGQTHSNNSLAICRRIV